MNDSCSQSIIDGVVWRVPLFTSEFGLSPQLYLFQCVVGLFCPSSLVYAALLSSYYRFPWNLFIGPLMLRDDFLLQHSLLLSFHHWKNWTGAKTKEVWRSIHPFIFETQTHAGSYQKKISPGLPTQPSSDFICRAMQPDTPTRALFW